MTETDPNTSSKFADLGPRLTAAIGLGLVSILGLWWGGWPLLVLCAVVAVIMLLEINAMCQARGDIDVAAGIVIVVGGGLAVLAIHFGILWFLALLAVSLTLSAILNKRADWIGMLGVFIITAGCAGIYVLRLEEGFWTILWIALCVVAADTGGYFFGKLFGGPKLWTRVSPKKTWSGVLGGVALSIVVALIFAMSRDGNVLSYVGFAIVIAVVALVGDLLESGAKRYYGVKDTGTILPGHGGLMDRFDGLTLVAIFMVAVSTLDSIRVMLGHIIVS